MRTLFVRLLFIFTFSCFVSEYAAQCGAGTPSFVVNLTSASNGTYTSPNTTRNDTCCGGVIAGECVKFIIFLHPDAMGINFGFASGAIPPGALFYQINCDTVVYPVGTPICLNGQGPHVLTFCKPGGNSNTYSITSIPKPSAPDSVLVRNGCTQTLTTSGFSIPTITWTAVPANTLYTSFLSCTVGCATVVVTPTGTALPPSVKYAVSGYGQSPCVSSFYSDTIEVFFYNDLLAGINPVNPTLCFGQNNAVLTVTTTGGLGPYTYSWTTGSTSNTIMVGPGQYTVLAFDKTGCPPTTATAQVFSFTLPITALAGPDYTLCNTSTVAPINGTVISASGGIWSGGGGAYVPSNTSLTANYIPTSAERAAGAVTLYLTTTGNAGCPPDQDTVVIRFQDPPVITATGDKTVCANNALTTLSATITNYPATAIWSSSGTGVFGTPTSTVTTFMPSSANIAAGSVQIVVTTTNNGSCGPDSDTVIVYITPAPVVNAGTDHTICSVGFAPLSGTISGATTTGSWSSSGNGSYNPNNTALSASYTPGSIDLTAGTVTLVLTSTQNNNCLLVRDTVKVFIRNQATVNAGPNFQVCSNPGLIPISGTVTGATTTGSWSSGGTGSFSSPPTILSNNYVASNADKTNGTVVFTLTSTNNGPCPAVNDTVMVRIRPLSVVSAGINSVICTTQNTIVVSGSVLTSPGTGSWSSGGTGFFTTPVNNLTVTYSLSPADLNAGFVNFTLTSTNNGVCPAVTDSMRLNAVKQPTVSAGVNLSICSSTTNITLNGLSAGSATSVVWNTSGGGNILSPNSPTTSYQISAADILAGSVIFTITSVNSPICPTTSDSVMVKITTQPTVNAGSIAPICTNQSSLSLSGTMTGGAGTATWSTAGSGTLTPNGNLNADYFISNADINNGFITFTLTSNNNGPCIANRDSLMVQLVKTATVNAGVNQNVCSNTGVIKLNGTIAGPNSAVVWNSSSNGSFNPANTVLSPTYGITSNDIQNGFVTFTLSSTNNGPCPVIADSVQIDITTLASVNSGSNTVICSSSKTLALNGMVSGSSTTGVWSASGGGVFTPTSTVLNPVYTLSNSDINGGHVTLLLTSTNNKSCPSVSDTVKMVIHAQPTVNAGTDYTTCSTVKAITLNGNVKGYSSTGIWSGTGTGSFTPANTALGGVYNITPEDIAKLKFQLFLTSTNNGVCGAHADTVNVNVILYPTINLKQDSTICQSDNPIFIAADVTGGSGAVQWISSGTGSFIPNSVSNPVGYIFGAGDLPLSDVNLTIKSVNNGPCGDVSSTLKVHLLPTPVAAFSASQYTITLPSAPIVFSNESKGGKTYHWDFGDGSESTLFSPSYLYRTVGFYTVQLIVTNQYRCTDTTERALTVISDVVFPNAFTPNPNGPNGGAYSTTDYASNLNDVFYPFTGGVVEYELMIFNRWGELLFTSDTLLRGWDGYFNGKLCQQDAYVWKATMKFFDGRIFNKTGTVTLLR